MTTTEPVRSSNAELAAMTLPQLKEVASQLGIDGAAKLKKDLLVTAISDLQAANREAAKAEREARREARNAKRDSKRSEKSEDSASSNNSGNNSGR
jgi:transcription termination factor Rho